MNEIIKIKYAIITSNKSHLIQAYRRKTVSFQFILIIMPTIIRAYVWASSSQMLPS